MDTLERAISIIHSCKRKLTHETSTMSFQALTAVIDAVAFSSANKQKLVASVQSRQASDHDGDSELSAPAAAAFVSHSSDIVDVNERLDGQRRGTVG